MRTRSFNTQLGNTSIAPKILCFIVAAASLAVSIQAYACTCMFDTQTGFIQRSASLPSNARGALFRAESTSQIIRHAGLITIIDNLPRPIKATSFIIKRAHSNVKLTAVIEKVKLAPFDDTEENQRVFYTKDKVLRTCIKTGDARSCRAAHADIEKTGWIQSLIVSGRLIEVTKQSAADGGLFRVMPVGGFVQGAQYLIERGTASIDLTIDKPLIVNATDRFTIGLLDQPKRQFISVARGASCSAIIPVTAQTLRYQLPQQFEAYRSSLVYFTERKHPPGEIFYFGAEVNKFFPWRYISSMCSQLPLGASELGNGEELVYTVCDGGGKPLVSNFVRGRVGLLEMGDKLYQTAEVEVEFDKAKTGSCTHESALLEAVEDRNANEIAQRACEFDAENAAIDPKQIYSAFRALQNLMHSEQSRTRACATRSAVQLYVRISLMNLKPVKPMTFKQRLNVLFLRPELSDAEIILKEIQAGMIDKDAEVKSSAKEAFNRMHELLWSRDSEIQLPAEEKNRLLQSSLQTIRDLLAKKEDDESSYYEAFRAISVLGQRANSLLPILLAMTNKPSTYSMGLESALADVAPNDPRVFDAIVRILKTGEGMRAASELVKIGQDKKPAVVDVLLIVIDANEYINSDVIDALGSMGKDARAAVPALYKLAGTSKFGNDRAKILEALVAIDEDDHRVVAAICEAIQHPFQGENGDDFNRDRGRFIYLLAKLGKKGNPALPTLKAVMTGKLDQYERLALETAFRDFQLSDRERNALLATLGKTILKP